MWTYLDVWLVQTGEIPQLAVGDVLEGLAVRVAWSSLEPAAAGDDVDDISETGDSEDGRQSPQHRIVGTVTWRREPRLLAVRSGSYDVLAEPRGHSAPAPSAEVGDRVAILASAYAVPDYELEADDLPDLRRSWLVRGLRVEHRELVSSMAHPGSTEPGRIVKVVEIPHMLRWADAPRGAHAGYLLDLVPAR